MSRSPASVGVKILGGGAAVLILFLVVGFLLPGRWEAEASADVPGTPQDVFRFVDSPEGWRRWTPWPDSGVVRSGPPRGKGATLSWNTPALGSGSFSLAEVDPPHRVEYTVDVGGGAMRTQGSITLSPEDGKVHVTWHEAGDLGRNPLMGYWALRMGKAQSAELSKGLERLATLVADSSAAPSPLSPVDSSGGRPGGA